MGIPTQCKNSHYAILWYRGKNDGFCGIVVGIVAGDKPSLHAAEAFMALRLWASVVMGGEMTVE